MGPVQRAVGIPAQAIQRADMGPVQRAVGIPAQATGVLRVEIISWVGLIVVQIVKVYQISE